MLTIKHPHLNEKNKILLSTEEEEYSKPMVSPSLNPIENITPTAGQIATIVPVLTDEDNRFR